MAKRTPKNSPRRLIGLIPPLRMEEEEFDDYQSQPPVESGRAVAVEPIPVESITDLLHQLMQERSQILQNQEFSSREKLQLLERNREMLIIMRGGSPYKFGSEKVIYSILAFSAVVLVVLASLTAFYELPQEVTITFVGTVLGGTIATIAQKLGKVGR